MNREQALKTLNDLADKFPDSPNTTAAIAKVLAEEAAAKQPAPFTRDQALVWLVENVKAWPCGIDGNGEPTGSCPEWSWIKTPGNWVFSSGNGDYLDNHDLEDWQSAQTAPASNKPSWDDAPADAKILVQSSNGLWNFGGCDSAYANEDTGWCGTGGAWFKSIRGDKPNPNWRDTLEYRPSTEESTPIDTRQAGSIAAGEALTEATTITPEQVAAIVGDAMAEENANLGKLGRSVLALKQIRADIEISEDKIRTEEANLRALKLGATSLSTDIKEALQYFGY